MADLKMLKEFENFYDAMMPAQEKSESCFAWFSGIPHPLFNIIMRLKTEKNLSHKIDSLITQLPSSVPLSF